MGTISITQAEKLYWLGRYAERAYTLIKMLIRYYDHMLDADTGAYRRYCAKLDIPDDFADKTDFTHRILSDVDSPFSIAYALEQANGNAMILRDRLATETISFIQSASNAVHRNFQTTLSVPSMRDVQNFLLAFWGAVDDMILTDNVRDFIKAGKYTERVDLYTRFEMEPEELDAAKRRLSRSLAHLDNAGICPSLADMLTTGRNVSNGLTGSGSADRTQ